MHNIIYSLSSYLIHPRDHLVNVSNWTKYVKYRHFTPQHNNKSDKTNVLVLVGNVHVRLLCDYKIIVVHVFRYKYIIFVYYIMNDKVCYSYLSTFYISHFFKAPPPSALDISPRVRHCRKCIGWKQQYSIIAAYI